MQENESRETLLKAEEQAQTCERETALPWTFDTGAVAEKSPRKWVFFAMFGGVTVLFALLLFFTMWLGNGGFKITRTVNTERNVFVHPYDTEGELLAPAEAAEVVGRSTVTVTVRTESGTGHGSGFIYRADGYIVTNAHVVENAVSVQVLFADGNAMDATVVGVSAENDLAVLKVEAADLPAVTLGRSADLLVGDDVVVIGAPAQVNYAGTATFGKISATKRLVALTDGTNITSKMTLIQTDAVVNNGNSGGPMADMYGHVIGVVVMKISYYSGTFFDGLGFAIPIDGAVPVIEALIRDGHFDGVSTITEGRTLIGVTGHGGAGGYWYKEDAEGRLVPYETEQAGAHYMPVSGVYVTEVTGENVQGKMQVGDIVTHVNGLAVTDITELIVAINRHYAGETVTLTVRRGEETVAVDVVLFAAE